MVVTKIRLYRESGSNRLMQEIIYGSDGLSQNNAYTNEIRVVVDGFELASDDRLRIAYEKQDGASVKEIVGYMRMKDNFDGTYSTEVPYVVTNGKPGATWKISLQIAGGFVEKTDDTTGETTISYKSKENATGDVALKINNTIVDRSGLVPEYPTVHDLDAFYSLAEGAIPNTEKGVPDGVAPLDKDGRIPSEYLPEDIGAGGGSGSGGVSRDEVRDVVERVVAAEVTPTVNSALEVAETAARDATQANEAAQAAQTAATQANTEIGKVNSALSGYVKNDSLTGALEGYVTDSELQGKGYKTEDGVKSIVEDILNGDGTQDSEYATKKFVKQEVAKVNTVGGGEGGGFTQEQIENFAKEAAIVQAAETADVTARNVVAELNIENGTTGGSVQQKGFTYTKDDGDIVVSGAKATGEGSVAFGGMRFDKTDKPQTEAIGKQSFAAGGSVVVKGDWSAGFGKDTKTFQKAAFAEGGGTVAGNEEDSDDNYSFAHAEGETTKAIGRGSHAEGWSGEAYGFYSHVEGVTTKTTTRSAHAEGFGTFAGFTPDDGQNEVDLGTLENPAHAEGYNTKATGYGAHAEGGHNVASGKYAHTGGANNVASGIHAHAQGEYTEASGRNSFAAGYWTKAAQDNQTVIGQYNHNKVDTLFEVGNGADADNRSNAFEVYQNGLVMVGDKVQQKDDNVAEGFSFIDKNSNAAGLDDEVDQWNKGKRKVDYGATGNFSSSFGGKSAAIGKRSHAEGTTTIAKANYSHAEGDNSVTLGADSHAEGYATVTGPNAQAGHAEGINTQALGLASHAEGQDTIAYGQDSHAEGSNTATVLKDEQGSVIGFGEAAHAEGGYTKAVGKYSHSEGHTSQASAEAAHAEGKNTIANDIGAHAEGNSTKASRPYAHAEGNDTNATGYHAHAEGKSTTAKGTNAHAEGDTTTAEGISSHAGGTGAHAKGNYSFAHGNMVVAGYANQFVVGQFNKNDELNIFEVGNGSNESTRSNNFEVRKDSPEAYVGGKRVLTEDDYEEWTFVLTDGITTVTKKVCAHTKIGV